MLAHINNVLMIVFSAQFFGPRETMTAAMYLLPFFGLVLPLRYYGGHQGRTGELQGRIQAKRSSGVGVDQRSGFSRKPPAKVMAQVVP